MPGRIILAAACALAIVLVGCSRELASVLAPNQPPEVTVSGAPASTSDTEAYAWRVTWRGADPDGRVARYLVALDPPSLDRVDTSWQSVDVMEQVLSFPKREALLRLGSATPARGSHVFAVCAEDDRGERSAPAWFAFGEGNLPPVVVITNPQPSPLFPLTSLPAITITWEGTDPDGRFTNRPVRYYYRMFRQDNYPDYPFPNFITWAVANPDSFRALYSPEFEGWQSSPSDSTFAAYTNLTQDQLHMFVVTGFDEVGDDDPVFSTSKNMLVFRVVLPGGDIGPILTMFNESFTYTYPSGGARADQSRMFNLSQPADRLVTFNWFAQPMPGNPINAYRWVLDPEDFLDETPRIGPDDLRHWSEWSPTGTSATIGPFPPSKETPHHFYIQARDNLGFVSMGIIRFAVQRAAPTRDLLIVDDTRLRPDQWINGTLQSPTGPWPSAAELDTFLYAIGGVPWREYPPGTMTTAGLFAGYAFDTLGTRRADPVRRATITAAELGQYRHVVWLTDQTGATMASSPFDPRTPKTFLRGMTQPGQVNELASYVARGGKLWLAGGGAASATLIDWNRPGHPIDLYSAAHGELAPGRMMYDFVHWRSELRAPSTGTSAPRSLTPGRGWPGQPDYGLLPAALARRTPASDPLPPRRTASTFYLPDFPAEVMTQPNEIVEEGASTLDTLYDVPQAGTRLPAMTYYHGPAHAPVLFSGFPPWEFRRAQCQGLIDFVLQQIWGLSPMPPAPRPGGGITGRAPDGSGTRVARARAPDGGARRP